MKVLITFLTFLSCSIVMAKSDTAYQLPITRDGVTITKVAYNFWSGEYPGPVVDVTKKTTIQAYASVRVLDEVRSCTIKKGLYHPWSQTKSSVVNFYTITGVNSYKVTQSYTATEATPVESSGLDGVDLLKGDQVINTHYLSEGWCRGTLVRQGNQPSDIDFFCDEIIDHENVSILSEDWDHDEQWFYLQCAEGYRAFVQDMSFLQQPNVAQGVITGYGEVGEAPAD